MITHKRNLWITSGLLLLMFGLWLYGLGWLHMRPDEHLVYVHTDTSLLGTIRYQATQDVQAPLWHAFFWAWRQVTGDSEFAGRYQGLLWSMLTVSLLYRMVWAMFGGARYGWAAVLLVGVNSHFFTYAFEIRPYPLVLLNATFATWCLYRWWQCPGWWQAALYGVSLALLAYTHYFLAFLVVAHGVYVLMRWPSRRHWMQLAGAAGLALLLWLPWASVFVGQVVTLREIDGTFGIASTTTATSWRVIANLNRLATNGLPWLVWGVILLGMVTVRRWVYGLLVLWAVGVPAIALTANLFVSVYDPRYIVYMSLGVGGAGGVALASLRGRWVSWGAVIGVWVLLLWALPGHLPDRTPHRTIYQAMSEMSRPDDVLFFDRGGEGHAYVDWLAEQYISPGLERVPTLEAAQQYRRVWHITGEIHNPAVRANFRELERLRPLTAVLGNCQTWCYYAQLLEGAPADRPVRLAAPNGDTLLFYGAEVIQPGDELQVEIWWMPDAPLALDYSVSVRLVDATGAIITQTDGPPTSLDGKLHLTSQLTPGRMMLDSRSLAVPPGLPAGQYSVQLVAYHPIEGYTLLGPGGDIQIIETISVS